MLSGTDTTIMSFLTGYTSPMTFRVSPTGITTTHRMVVSWHTLMRSYRLTGLLMLAKPFSITLLPSPTDMLISSRMACKPVALRRDDILLNIDRSGYSKKGE